MANKYRIYPTRFQSSWLENQFSMCRYLYNWNLEERINLYKPRGKIISYNQQLKTLPGMKRESPWFKSVQSQVMQVILPKLNRAWGIWDSMISGIFQMDFMSRPLNI